MAAEPGTPSLKEPGQIACDLGLGVRMQFRLQSTIATLQSRTLREALAERCRETPDLATKCVLYTELIENIARGELLRLLPLEIQARIFSFISLGERLRVLETISGGQGESGNKQTDLVRSIWKKISGSQNGATAVQRVQANFRRAVLETYKSVKTIKDLGPKCSKLQLLQATGGRLENLQSRFPNLQLDLDGSELQGYICVSRQDYRLRIVQINGHETDLETKIRNIRVIEFAQVDSTSIMIIETGTRKVLMLKLSELSVRDCARIPHLPPYTGDHPNIYLGSATLCKGFVYWRIGAECARYSIAANSWEKLAHMNHDYVNPGKLVTWNDSVYFVGGHIDRYDSENNKWMVVFKQGNFNGGIHSAIVVENILYCCARSKEHHGCWSIWRLDMRTGEECEELHRGLPELADDDFRIDFFAKEGQVGFWLTNYYYPPPCSFALDQYTSMWICVDSVDDSVGLGNVSGFRDAWPLLL